MRTVTILMLNANRVARLWLQNAEKLDSHIIYDRDFDYDYFGFKVSLSSVASSRPQIKGCTYYLHISTAADAQSVEVSTALHAQPGLSVKCVIRCFSKCYGGTSPRPWSGQR